MSAALAREWYSAAELAEMGLPGLPGTKQGVLKLAKRRAWAANARTRIGRGGGVEYHRSLVEIVLYERVHEAVRAYASAVALLDWAGRA
jgi:hypothetical protein